MKKDYGDSIISIPSMHRPTEIDRMSVQSVLKVVNNESDATPTTPIDVEQSGIFASIKAVFTGKVFGTDTQKQEKNYRMENSLSESIVIEKKSSEENDSDKNKSLRAESENGLPMVMDCEDYAYQSSGDENEGKSNSYLFKQPLTTIQSESADLLNEAQVCSKPMSVLDQLENFWEDQDANRGKKGIRAEDIMEL